MTSKLVMMIGLFLLVACGKEDSMIPDTYVNFRFSDTEYQQRRDANGLYLVNGYGVAGLVIFKVTGGEYVAFDRCSTVNPEKRCAVQAGESAFTLTDPCSGAMFSVLDGAPAKAPATRALRQYSVVQSQPGFYTVIN